METSFAEAFLYREHTVLGVKLRPFCLWHRAVLESLGSPYATGDFSRAESLEEEFADLRLAVAVCASGYDPGLKCIDPPETRRENRRENKLLVRYFAHLPEEAQKFLAYLADFAAAPELYSKTGKDAPVPPAGWGFHEVTLGFLARAGIHGAEAWEMPLAQAKWMALQIRMTLSPFGPAPGIVTDGARRIAAEIEARKEAG